MVLFGSFVVLSAVCSVGASSLDSRSSEDTQLDKLAVTREGTHLQLNGSRWTSSGANVYWLGLDENVIPDPVEPFYDVLNASYPTKGRITEVMKTLNAMGATTIRSHTLGISVGNPLSLMPERGIYNNDAFDPMDWAIYQAGLHGLKIVVPLTDNYDYYHGGKFTFLRWRGFNITTATQTAKNSTGYPIVQHFYTNATIVEDFKDYIRYLLSHRNQFNNLTYAEDPTIFAYESGNELGGPVFGDMWVPNAWIKDIAQLVKELAPMKLFVDGTYGVNKTHFAISEIDIFSNHYYPVNVTKLKSDIAAVEATNRVYQIGEYDWTGKKGDSLRDFFTVIEAQQAKNKSVIVGDVFWSLFGRNSPDCSRFVNHTDGLTLHYGNPKNTAQQNEQISTIKQHFAHMVGKNVNVTMAAVAC